MSVVPDRRPLPREAVEEAAQALRRLLAAVDAGELGEMTNPKEVALIRRLQGTLVGWQTALGEEPPTPDHSE